MQSNLHLPTKRIFFFNKKHIFLSVFISIILTSFCQAKEVIYLFPGQGSDYRIFNEISFDTSLFNVMVIEYDIPEKSMTMKEYAKELSIQVDTSGEYILIGVSLGGMICVELSEYINPSKTIIISSAKNRQELPFRFKFQRIIPLYKVFPRSILLLGAKVLQPIVEPDRNKNKQIFKSMLASKNPTYMKRTIGMVITWDRVENSKMIYHIHGTNDHTIPFRNITDPDYVIENGSHMMTLTRAEEISRILKEIIEH